MEFCEACHFVPSIILWRKLCVSNERKLPCSATTSWDLKGCFAGNQDLLIFTSLLPASVFIGVNFLFFKTKKSRKFLDLCVFSSVIWTHFAILGAKVGKIFDITIMKEKHCFLLLLE
jgi:hypothetical protein